MPSSACPRGSANAVVSGVDAVIAAVGPRRNAADDAASVERGMLNIVGAMGAARVIQLIALPEPRSGFRATGSQRSTVSRRRSFDEWPVTSWLPSSRSTPCSRHRASTGRPYARRSTATWPTGIRAGSSSQTRARVTRADVAQALLDQVRNSRYNGLAPFLPRRRTWWNHTGSMTPLASGIVARCRGRPCPRPWARLSAPRRICRVCFVRVPPALGAARSHEWSRAPHWPVRRPPDGARPASEGRRWR